MLEGLAAPDYVFAVRRSYYAGDVLCTVGKFGHCDTYRVAFVDECGGLFVVGVVDVVILPARVLLENLELVYAAVWKFGLHFEFKKPWLWSQGERFDAIHSIDRVLVEFVCV